MSTIPATPPPMPLSARAKIDLAIGVALLVAFVIVGRAWLGEHDDRLRAEASVAASQKSFDQAAAQMKQLQDADKVRDAQTAATIAKISDAAAAQKTPEQIVKWIPAQLGPLPAPVKASIAPATPQDPTPPAIITVPQQDLPALREEVASCKKNAVELTGTQQDLASCQAQQKVLESQVKDREEQISALKQELKGGTLWHRLKSGAKKIAIGGAIAAVTICASGHCK